MKSQRILILGATGGMGSALAREPAQGNNRIRVAVRDAGRLTALSKDTDGEHTIIHGGLAVAGTQG